MQALAQLSARGVATRLITKLENVFFYCFKSEITSWDLCIAACRKQVLKYMAAFWKSVPCILCMNESRKFTTGITKIGGGERNNNVLRFRQL